MRIRRVDTLVQRAGGQVGRQERDVLALPRHGHELRLRDPVDGQRLPPRVLPASKVLGWPKRYKLAHAFLWEYIYKRLKLAQLLGQLGDFLTWEISACPSIARRHSFAVALAHSPLPLGTGCCGSA